MNNQAELSEDQSDSRSWYEGISQYQWLVLLIASLGWMFDVFEGQIFVASMRDAMARTRVRAILWVSKRLYQLLYRGRLADRKEFDAIGS